MTEKEFDEAMRAELDKIAVNQLVKKLEVIRRAGAQLLLSSNLEPDYALFACMITAVRDVFGESHMTEAVICEAIKAASYAACSREGK